MTDVITRTEHPAPTAYVPFVVSVVLFGAGLWLATAGSDLLEAEDVVDGAMLMLFPLVGAMLLQRGRYERVGTMCCAVGISAGLGYLVGGYADHDWPGRSLAGVVGSATFVLTIVILMNFLPLLFPDGHLPSRRWRVVSAAGAVGGAVSVLTVLFMPGRVDEDAVALGTNPIGVSALEPALEVAELASLVVFAAVALLAIASLVVRWRRATGETRRQIGILAAGVAVLIGLFLLDSTLQEIGGAAYGIVAAVVALGAVPLAIAVALLPD